MNNLFSRRRGVLIAMLGFLPAVSAAAQEPMKVNWTTEVHLRTLESLAPVSEELTAAVVECIQTRIQSDAPTHAFTQEPGAVLEAGHPLIVLFVTGLGEEGERISDAEFLYRTAVNVVFPGGGTVLMGQTMEGSTGEVFYPNLLGAEAQAADHYPPCPTDGVSRMLNGVVPRLQAMIQGGGS